MLIEQILSLPVKQQLSPSLSLVSFGELTLIAIKHKTCQAIISLQGAQLLHWRPINTDAPIIWLSEKTPFVKHKPIRGGVPICWPHFADFGEPMHGFARLLDWQLIDYKENEDGVLFNLQLTNSDVTKPYINQNFMLDLTIELGLDCQVQLQMQAENLLVTTALHSYFNISNISNILVKGLGKDYQERFTPIEKPKKEGQLVINQMVDRIYTAPDPITMIKDMHRTIHINHLNASDIVVWNPWSTKCQYMLDMDTNGYQTMICVETGAITKPIHCLASRSPVVLGFKIEQIAS